MENIKRKLQIAFMDSLSLETRNRLIKSGESVEEIVKRYNLNCDNEQSANNVITWISENKNTGICWYGDDNYPDFSCFDRRAPFMLLYKGLFPEKNRKSVAIVGTRKIDNAGFQLSFKLGLEASLNGISVVSGIADGCDQAALSGAVNGKYPSYAVLGCGLNYDYPKSSERLKRQILDTGGALISRFCPDYPPLKYNFPSRNMIISAMGNCTIVVQAPIKSGSLITSDFTLQEGKEVFTTTAGIGNVWNRRGSNELFADGAKVIDSVSEIFECKISVNECSADDKSGIRFGNRHYFPTKTF